MIGLDILRSLAIILVILSHWTNSFAFWYGIKIPTDVFFCGDLGVDLFFALSGFLIGRILLDITVRDPSWRSVLVFLIRRWLRTLPVYSVWLLILAIFFPPAAHLADYLLRFGTLTQNLAQPMPHDYWFSVSWSLTIEEWFYLLFGTAAIASAMAIGRAWAIWLPLMIMLVVPVVLRLTIAGFLDWDSGYSKMVPFRLDEIGYGVVLAWLYTRRSWVFDHPFLPLVLGLFLIAAAWLDLLPMSFPVFVIFQHNLAVIGCALCIPAALSVRTAPRWLDFLATHTARLSYTLYLVHLTILVDVAQWLWATHRVSTQTAVVIGVVGPFVVAELMSRLIEQPFMRIRPRQFAVPTPEGRALITT